jgi:translation initiation factor IF-3
MLTGFLQGRSSSSGDRNGCAAHDGAAARFSLCGRGRRFRTNLEVMAINIPKKPTIRVNDRIRIPQIRVIDEAGNQLGIMSNTEALSMAQERGLDLVEISPTARPPVCKIMDYGKFKYEESKQARKARKNQHVMLIKEVKLRPKIDDHDYNFKVNHARHFLTHKDKVKFTVTFRGREMVHMDQGRKILDDVVKDLADIGVVEIPPRVEGRTMTLYMIPKKETPGGAGAAKPAAGEAPRREGPPAPRPAAQEPPKTGGNAPRSAAPDAPKK